MDWAGGASQETNLELDYILNINIVSLFLFYLSLSTPFIKSYF